MELIPASRSEQSRSNIGTASTRGLNRGPPTSYIERISCPVRRRFYETLEDDRPKRKPIMSAASRKSRKIDQTNENCPCAGEPALQSKASETDHDERVKIQQHQRLFCSRDSYTNTKYLMQDSQRPKKEDSQTMKLNKQSSGKQAMAEGIRQWERSLRESRRKQTYIAPNRVNRRLKRSELNSSSSSESTIVGCTAKPRCQRHRHTKRILSTRNDHHCSHDHHHECVSCPVHGDRSVSSIPSTVRLAPRRKGLISGSNESKPLIETKTKKSSTKRQRCRTGLSLKQNKKETMVLPTNESRDHSHGPNCRQKITENCYDSTSYPKIIDCCITCRQKLSNSPTYRQNNKDKCHSPTYRQKTINNCHSHSPITRERVISNCHSHSPITRERVISNCHSHSPITRERVISNCHSHSPINRENVTDKCHSPTKKIINNFEDNPRQVSSKISKDQQNFSSQYDVENQGIRVTSKEIQKKCIPAYLTRRSRSPYFNRSRSPYFNRTRSPYFKKQLCYRVTAKENGLKDAAMYYDSKTAQQFETKNNASGFKEPMQDGIPNSSCFVIRARGRKDRILTKRPLRHMDIKPTFTQKAQTEVQKQTNITSEENLLILKKIAFMLKQHTCKNKDMCLLNLNTILKQQIDLNKKDFTQKYLEKNAENFASTTDVTLKPNIIIQDESSYKNNNNNIDSQSNLNEIPTKDELNKPVIKSASDKLSETLSSKSVNPELNTSDGSKLLIHY